MVLFGRLRIWRCAGIQARSRRRGHAVTSQRSSRRITKLQDREGKPCRGSIAMNPDRNTSALSALWRGAGDGPGSSGPESHGFLIQGPAVFPRGIEQAKEFLGVRWVLHPQYEPAPPHSRYD